MHDFNADRRVSDSGLNQLIVLNSFHRWLFVFLGELWTERDAHNQ